MLYEILFSCLVCHCLGLDGEEYVYVKRGPVRPLPAYSSLNTDSLLNKYTHTPDTRTSSEAVQTVIADDLENISKFARTVRRYFDFESGGQTWLGNLLQELVSSREGRSQLGQFLGWKGDLLEPLAILSLCSLSLYVASQILAILAPSVAVAGSRTFSSLTSLLATAVQTLWDKLVLVKDLNVGAINTLVAPFLGGEEGGEANRRRRAVEDLTNIVQAAITKYQNRE